MKKEAQQNDSALVPTLRFPQFHNETPWSLRCLGEDGDFLSSLSGKGSTDFGVGSSRFIPYSNVFANTFTNPLDLGCVKVGENETQNKVRRGDVLFTTSSETLMSMSSAFTPAMGALITTFSLVW